MAKYTNIENGEVDSKLLDDESLVALYVFLRKYIFITENKDNIKKLKDLIYKEIKERKLIISSFKV